MKNRSALAPLLCSLLLAVGPLAGAETAAAPAETRPVLTIVVVDSLHSGAAESITFDRIARVFTEVFEKQKWPVKIETERFGANSPDYPIELRVFYEGIRPETPVDLTFRAWMTLYDHGKKHDFGIIRFVSYPRPGRNFSDQLDEAARGAAGLVAAKIGPVLFPPASAAKP